MREGGGCGGGQGVMRLLRVLTAAVMASVVTSRKGYEFEALLDNLETMKDDDLYKLLDQNDLNEPKPNVDLSPFNIPGMKVRDALGVNIWV